MVALRLGEPPQDLLLGRVIAFAHGNLSLPSSFLPRSMIPSAGVKAHVRSWRIGAEQCGFRDLRLETVYKGVLQHRSVGYSGELAPLFPPANEGPLDEEAVGAVREKYGLEMDMGSIPVLAERHGLLVDAPPPSGK
jgi:hypothetical protein